MTYPGRLFLVLACLVIAATAGTAHYNMLLPETASARREQLVTFQYQWGHPFEHQLFAAPEPQRVAVLLPDGKQIDLGSNLEKVTQPQVAYRFRFKPSERGDYLFLLTTPPIWLEEDQEFLQDQVKVVFHVQVQKGWDRAAGEDFELVPLTRPYGLQPGMVFQAQALADGKPLSGGLVEIEQYHAVAPKVLPPDEQITRTAKTDANGVVTCTLPEAGWWCITAQRPHGEREHAGKNYPVRQRTTLWVFVDDKETAKIAK